MFNENSFYRNRFAVNAWELFCGILLLVISKNHTHFSILNKKNIERDEDAEVEDVNIVLDGHLRISQKGKLK